MREIIGENMCCVFADIGLYAKLAYTGSVGGWPKFEVWQMSDAVYEEFWSMNESIDDDEFSEKYPDSWWRGAVGSNMGVPDDTFVINSRKITAWRNEYKDMSLINKWWDLSEDERDEYIDFDDYAETWCPHVYKNILDYFCCVLGASTKRNVCALATDLAKWNEITVAELFRKYG